MLNALDLNLRKFVGIIMDELINRVSSLFSFIALILCVILFFMLIDKIHSSIKINTKELIEIQRILKEDK